MAEPLALRGMNCPLVVLKIRRALGAVAPGRTLAVLADDPMAMLDLPAMCHHARFDLVESERAEGQINFAIRKPEGWTRPSKPGPIK